MSSSQESATELGNAYGLLSLLELLSGLAAIRSQSTSKAYPMNNSVKSLALAAAFAGLIGGTTVRLNAQTAQSNGTSVQSTHAGVLLVQDTTQPKHACKGQNDCKGQGGGDKKHAGKNDCKGKGGCATDGSTPPKAV
jgi:hypothetical protein